MGIFRKRPEEVRKRRTIKETGAPKEPAINFDIEEESEKLVQETFNRLADNINVANELLPIFEDKCRATHIPVIAELDDIRAAVKRLDSNEPNGARISFPLFLSLIKKQEKVSLDYTLYIAESFTGDINADSKVVQTMKTRVTSGIIDAKDILIFTSLWFLNYVAAKYQDQFNIPTITQIASSSPGAAAIGAAKLTIAFAFASVIDAVHEEYARELDNRGQPVPEISNSAVNEVELTRLEQLAVKKVGEGDHDAVLNYAIDYIYGSNDQRYDPWVQYLTIRRARNENIDSYRYYPAYSSSAFLKTNTNIFGKEEQQEQDDFQTRVEDNLKNKALGYITKSVDSNFSFNQTQTFTRLNEKANKSRVAINTAAQAASYKMTKDQICCFIRILSKNTSIRPKDLHILRCIIRASSKTISLKLRTNLGAKIKSAIKSVDLNASLIDYFKGVLSSMLSNVYNGLYSKLENEVADKLGNECISFYNFVQLVFDIVDDILTDFNESLDIEQSEEITKLINQQNALETKFHIRILNDIETMLAAIIDNALYDCVETREEGADEAIDDVVTGLNLPSNQYTINISEDLANRHFSNSKALKIKKVSSTFEEELGIFIPPIRAGADLETSEEMVRDILKTCKIKVSDNDIKQMLRDTDGSSR